MPIHKLHFWLKGDNSKCSYGVQVTDAGGETHQYGKNTGQGGLIDFAGWKEALKLMPAGSKWQVVVPPHLAYGDRGMGRDIGPAATLLFEVELLSVK